MGNLIVDYINEIATIFVPDKASMYMFINAINILSSFNRIIMS